ncbi:hypothetical protein ACFO0S_01870 [Chryseomicrobium palamuruense]|uniref:Lipoprotein n=1 Tax=Chryseomicrobium palamuruense TaxID=682973 RepID=A0ABV8UR99_9BACL
MKKIGWLALSLTFLWLGGCAMLEQPSPPQMAIEWADVIQWNGNHYYLDEEATQTYNEDLVGKEIGEVTFQVLGSKEEDNSTYQLKDGEATFLSKGSKIYSVKGKEVSEVILIRDKVYSFKGE